MAGDTPAEAVAAFLRRVRSTLGCLSSATVFASRSVSGVPRSLVIFAEGQRAPDRVLLPTHGGSGDLVFHTQQILLEDVVELLIREFLVDPLHSNWQSIVQENRDAGLRAGTR